MTFAVFHEFPGLETGLPKFHDFPGPVVTLKLEKTNRRTNYIGQQELTKIHFQLKAMRVQLKAMRVKLRQQMQQSLKAIKDIR